MTTTTSRAHMAGVLGRVVNQFQVKRLKLVESFA